MNLLLHVEPSREPHALQWRCEACHAPIKWLSVRIPAKRVLWADEHRKALMVEQAPTDRQLNYLHTLGHIGSQSATRLEASELIDNLLQPIGN
jgi:hypothetical protein